MMANPKIFEHEGTKYVPLKDGKVVYVGDDGSELEYDPVQMHGKINALNKESQQRREALEQLQGKYKPFDGLDPAQVSAAVEFYKTNKDAPTPDKIEEMKSTIKSGYERDLAELKLKLDQQEANHNQERLQARFYQAANSDIAQKIAVPMQLLIPLFESNFKNENGRFVASDANGNPIYSSVNHGELADFEEALMHLINTHQLKNNLLLGDGHQGTGTGHTKGGAARRMTRAELNALDPKKKSEAILSQRKGEIVILD